MDHAIIDGELVPRKEGKRRFRRQILDDWGHTCYLCGAQPQHLTLDHLIPRRIGGETCRHNLAPACAPCNRRKGSSELWAHWTRSDHWDQDRALRLIRWLLETARVTSDTAAGPGAEPSREPGAAGAADPLPDL
ncbi:MAG TPA: HNH endonuclease [Mycobacterium sp.]|nr:HNH endonuclease [Mycobacterium sp.]